MAASVNDKFRRSTDSTGAVPASLASAKAAGASTAALTVATGWPTSTGVDVVMYLIDTSGVKVAGSQTSWVATLAGTTLSGLSLQQGTEPSTGYPGTDRTIVTVRPTAAWCKAVIDGILAQHNQDGTHGAITTTGYSQASGAFTVPNNSIDANELSTSAITLGYAQITANFSTTSTSFVDVTGLTTTVVVPAGGRRVEFNIDAPGINTSGGNIWCLALLEDGVVIQQWYRNQDTATALNIPLTLHYSKIPSAGTHTYKVQLATTAGTAVISASTTSSTPLTSGPAQLLAKAI